MKNHMVKCNSKDAGLNQIKRILPIVFVELHEK